MSSSRATRFLSSLLPPLLSDLIRRRRRAILERNPVNVKCGKYTIEVPGDHILARLGAAQPHRDICVGVVAQYMGAKYANKAIVDIGANVGDTACIIASYAINDLFLVEASSEYFPIMERNVRQLPNRLTLRNALVSDGELLRGELRHGSGTASFQRDPLARETQTVRIQDIAGDSVCMVKTDTDGFDYRILSDALEWLSRSRPAILFEDYIASVDDLNASNLLCEQLSQIGYERYVVWDDAGRHILSTTSLDVIRDLHGYLFELGQAKEPYRGIWNYDVLCLHTRDSDVFAQVSSSVRNRS